MTTESQVSTAVVIVSFNRRDLLLESLSAVLSQEVQPSRVIVVDNASDDGSADAVAHSYPQVELFRLPRNVGGAGGFAVGLAHALQGPADWVWLMDDDTIPTPSALARLLDAARSNDRIDLVGSRVVWTDGSDHPMNTPREKPFVTLRERNEAAQAGGMAVRSSSFVSMLVRADAVRARGLPLADYFIWNDDFEFSTRILRRRRGIFVPASIVVHKTRMLGSTDTDPGPRFYYEVRNKLWMLLRSRSLSPWEKVLYGGSTVRRWVRTIARSVERRPLWSGLVRGIRDGVRAPRPNSEVLAGMGTFTTAVIDHDGQRGRS